MWCCWRRARMPCALFTSKGMHAHTRAGPEYSNIRSVGWHSIFNFEIRICFFFFFFWTPGIPRETVLNLSAWLNICSSNRPFANERCSCWPIACIFHEKSSISYKRACRTSNVTFEIMNLSAQKTRHVNGPSAITKPNAIHAFSLSTVPRCEWKSWISVQ